MAADIATDAGLPVSLASAEERRIVPIRILCPTCHPSIMCAAADGALHGAPLCFTLEACDRAPIFPNPAPPVRLSDHSNQQPVQTDIEQIDHDDESRFNAIQQFNAMYPFHGYRQKDPI